MLLLTFFLFFSLLKFPLFFFFSFLFLCVGKRCLHSGKSLNWKFYTLKQMMIDKQADVPTLMFLLKCQWNSCACDTFGLSHLHVMWRDPDFKLHLFLIFFS